MIGVRVELFDGKMHPLDSKDIAFHIAGHKAFRIAAQRATPVITAPFYALDITAPDRYAGDGFTTISAHARLVEVLRYATDLRSVTQGRGRFAMEFAHYEDVPTHLAQQLTINKVSGI